MLCSQTPNLFRLFRQTDPHLPRAIAQETAEMDREQMVAQAGAMRQPETQLGSESTALSLPHILNHRDHLVGSPAHTAKADVTEPLAHLIEADRVQCAAVAIVAGPTVQAWTRARSPSTENRWTWPITTKAEQLGVGGITTMKTGIPCRNQISPFERNGEAGPEKEA